MNCLKISIVLAMCVAVAVSSPCTTQCMGACALAKQNCDASGLLGPACGVAFGTCAAGCTNICGCIDGCDTTCAPALETCQSAASNLIGKAQCVVENDVCNGNCQNVCALQKTQEAVQALVAQGLGVVGGVVGGLMG